MLLILIRYRVPLRLTLFMRLSGVPYHAARRISILHLNGDFHIGINMRIYSFRRYRFVASPIATLLYLAHFVDPLRLRLQNSTTRPVVSTRCHRSPFQAQSAYRSFRSPILSGPSLTFQLTAPRSSGRVVQLHIPYDEG